MDLHALVAVAICWVGKNLISKRRPKRVGGSSFLVERGYGTSSYEVCTYWSADMKMDDIIFLKVSSCVFRLT